MMDDYGGSPLVTEKNRLQGGVMFTSGNSWNALQRNGFREENLFL